MKVGIDARFLTHPQRGGFKTYTRTVLSALAEADSECEYVLYTDRPADIPLARHANFTVRPVPGPNSLVREQLLLPLVMKRDRVDIAHFPCNTAPILFGPRMVVTVHDTIALRDTKYSDQSSIKQRFLNSYWRAVTPRCARKADLVITDSEYVQRELERDLGLPAERMRVIPIAVNPAFLQQGHAVPAAEIDPGTQFILAFASPDGRKNQVGAIEAYRSVAAECPGLKLVLVCSHPGVRTSIRPDDGIVPLGPVPLGELLWLYKNALALVFPSLDEGFGLPPLEAMACGTPVVVSKAGSLPEVVGDCAVFVDPSDVSSIAEGIKLILSNQALRTRLIRDGRQHAARFDHVSMGRKLVAAYSEAAHGMRE